MSQSHVETVSSSADKAKVYTALALVLLGVVAFYLLAKQGVYVQWGALVLALVLAAVVFLTSGLGKEFIAYVKSSIGEMKKVVWPTRKEATQVTLYVFAFVAVMALFMLLTDKTIEWVLYDLILGWKK